MYGKVIKVNKTNIEVLCFNGNNLTINKKKNFLTNTETICTVLNMFDMFNKNSNDDAPQMNALMMPMIMSGMLNDENESTSENTTHGNEALFMMFYMMQNQKNPMMAMLPMMLLNKGGSKSDMFETLMMMQLMKNENFSNMFGPCYNKIDESKPAKKTNTIKSDKKDKPKDDKKDQD